MSSTSALSLSTAASLGDHPSDDNKTDIKVENSVSHNELHTDSVSPPIHSGSEDTTNGSSSSTSDGVVVPPNPSSSDIKAGGDIYLSKVLQGFSLKPGQNALKLEAARLNCEKCLETADNLLKTLAETDVEITDPFKSHNAQNAKFSSQAAFANLKKTILKDYGLWLLGLRNSKLLLEPSQGDLRLTKGLQNDLQIIINDFLSVADNFFKKESLRENNETHDIIDYFVPQQLERSTGRKDYTFSFKYVKIEFPINNVKMQLNVAMKLLGEVKSDEEFASWRANQISEHLFNTFVALDWTCKLYAALEKQFLADKKPPYNQQCSIS